MALCHIIEFGPCSCFKGKSYRLTIYFHSIQYFQNNILEWMRKYYPAFNWTYTKKRRIELDPGASSFIIAPEIVEVVSIKGSDIVSYYSLDIYIHVHRCTF